ncbi:MAG: AzlD domain-containing protein [Treponema sp.]|nr:AzlD domain-containing protein [Treponema sp.]
MITSVHEALLLALAMGAVILFCRAFPFLFFGGKDSGVHSEEADAKSLRKAAFLTFVEKTVPPAAMTVLAFNALGGAFRYTPEAGLLVLAASVFTALVHIWKRNPLISIFGGTAVYMILLRVV